MPPKGAWAVNSRVPGHMIHPVSLRTQPQELLIRHVFSLITCLFNVPHSIKKSCMLLVAFYLSIPRFPLSLPLQKEFSRVIFFFTFAAHTLHFCLKAVPSRLKRPTQRFRKPRRIHSHELDGLLLYLKKQTKKNYPLDSLRKRKTPDLNSGSGGARGQH